MQAIFIHNNFFIYVDLLLFFLRAYIFNVDISSPLFCSMENLRNRMILHIFLVCGNWKTQNRSGSHLSVNHFDCLLPRKNLIFRINSRKIYA